MNFDFEIPGADGNSYKLEWFSRDNLSSPPFTLVTNMKSFYNFRSEIQGKIVIFDKLGGRGVWGGGGGGGVLREGG